MKYIDWVNVYLAISEPKRWTGELCSKVGGVICARVGIAGWGRDVVQDIGGVEMHTDQWVKFDHAIRILLRSPDSVLAPHVCAEVRKRPKACNSEQPQLAIARRIRIKILGTDLDRHSLAIPLRSSEALGIARFPDDAHSPHRSTRSCMFRTLRVPTSRSTQSL